MFSNHLEINLLNGLRWGKNNERNYAVGAASESRLNTADGAHQNWRKKVIFREMINYAASYVYSRAVEGENSAFQKYCVYFSEMRKINFLGWKWSAELISCVRY